MLAESLAGLVAISASDLVVTDPDGVVQVQGTDYEITGNLRTGTASIRTLRAYPVGVALDVRRVTDRVQKASIPFGQPLPSQAIERELDRQALISGEQDVEMTRAVRVPVGQVGPDFPSLDDAEGHVLGVAGGKLIPVQNDLISAASDAALASTARMLAQAAAASANASEVISTADLAGCNVALAQAMLAALAAGAYDHSYAAVVPAGIANGKPYWTASADSKGLLLWKNNAGAPAAVLNPDTSQVEIPNSIAVADLTALAGILAGVTGSALVSVGYAGTLAEPWDGGATMTAVGGPWKYVIGKAAGGGPLQKMSFGVSTFGLGTGVLNVLIMEEDTVFPTLKVVSSHAVTIGASGQVDITAADFGAITLTADQYVGFSIPAGSITLLGKRATTPVTFVKNGPASLTSGTDTFVALGGGDSIFARFTQLAETLQVKEANFDTSLASIPKLAVSASPKQWLIVPICGQSHGEPHSGTDPVIILPTGIAKKYYGSNPTLTLNLTDFVKDPVGPTLGIADNTHQSGIAPALVQEIWARTGMGVIIVPCAEGGSGLISEGLGGGRNWAPPGTAGASDGGGILRAEALARIQNAMQAATDAGLAWQLGPMVWTQGGTESLRYDHAVGVPWTDFGGNVITAANRAAALGVLFTWFRTQLARPNLPVVISYDPPKNTGVTAGTLMVNQSLKDYVASDEHAYLGYTAIQNWAARGIMIDTYHGNGVAYDEMGAHLGRAAANVAYKA